MDFVGSCVLCADISDILKFFPAHIVDSVHCRLCMITLLIVTF